MAEDKTKTNGGTVATPDKPKTEAELMAEMDKALKSKDFKAVSKVSAELVKFQKDKESAEIAAKEKKLEGMTDKVKVTIQKALQKMVESGELDEADGIWYTNDFGEKLVTCRLMKTQAKARTSGGGGGGGKKFSVSTDELLEKFGGEAYKDGKSFKEAWDSNTDKNFRYAIRESLLKKGGYIT